MFDKIGKISLERKYGEIIPMQKAKEDYREFMDRNEASSWGESIYKEWAKKYKETMRKADESVNDPLYTSVLECYLGNMYRDINQVLRNNDQENIYSKLTDLMKIVVCSAPRIPENIVVYRKVDNHFTEMLVRANKTGAGSVFQEKGFMSTGLVAKTLIDRKGEVFSEYKNMLKIYVDKETKGFYADVINSRDEQEMVIYPNSYLRMVEYPYMQNGIMIYECELITFEN